MTPDADPLLERPPDSPPKLRSSTSRSRLALFVCLIALGALAARLAEYGRGQGLPWHGFVDGWLIRSTRFTGDNVPRQLEMTALQGLDIVDTPVHDAGLLAIANKAAAAGTLDWLELSKTKISAAGWSQLLARNERVRWSVAVEDPSLTDTDLAAISKLPMIELKLNCPKVTGAGLTQLRETPRLRRLNLTVLELDGPSIDVLTELLQQGVEHQDGA